MARTAHMFFHRIGSLFLLDILGLRLTQHICYSGVLVHSLPLNLPSAWFTLSVCYSDLLVRFSFVFFILLDLRLAHSEPFLNFSLSSWKGFFMVRITELLLHLPPRLPIILSALRSLAISFADFFAL